MLVLGLGLVLGEFCDSITGLASLLKWKNIQELFLEFGAILFFGLGVGLQVRVGVKK